MTGPPLPGSPTGGGLVLALALSTTEVQASQETVHVGRKTPLAATPWDVMPEDEPPLLVSAGFGAPWPRRHRLVVSTAGEN
jgi:hypothetical protein